MGVHRSYERPERQELFLRHFGAGPVIFELKKGHVLDPGLPGRHPPLARDLENRSRWACGRHCGFGNAIREVVTRGWEG